MDPGHSDLDTGPPRPLTELGPAASFRPEARPTQQEHSCHNQRKQLGRGGSTRWGESHPNSTGRNRLDQCICRMSDSRHVCPPPQTSGGLVRSGLSRGTRFQDRRHTYAAFLIAERAHPQAMMERMDHSSINVTLGTCGHLFPSIDAQLECRSTQNSLSARPTLQSGLSCVWICFETRGRCRPAILLAVTSACTITNSSVNRLRCMLRLCLGDVTPAWPRDAVLTSAGRCVGQWL